MLASPIAPAPPAARPPGTAARGRRLLAIALSCLVIALLAIGGLCVTQLAGEVTATPSAAGHHDFLAFHAAAELVRQGRPGLLYDPAAVTALERHVIAVPVGATGYMPFINPPFAAALQAPLALLSEPAARLVWLLLSLALAGWCCWLATAGLERWVRVAGIAVLLSTFPVFQALVEGQWSFVLLAGCLLALRLWPRRPAAAGASLAVLALKPPLLVPVLVVLLLTRSWRALAGAVGAVLAVGLVTLPVTGWATQLDYAGYLVAVLGSHLDGAGAAGAAVWHGGLASMEGVNGLAAGYVGQRNVVLADALTAGAAAVVVGRWSWVAWRRARPGLDGERGRRLLVAGIAAGLLTDLHLFPQDCVLLILALPVLTCDVAPRLRLATVAGLAAVLDLSWLDQLRVTPHLFTWALLAGFAAAAGRAAGAPARLPRRARRAAAASAVAARQLPHRADPGATAGEARRRCCALELDAPR